MGIKHKFLFLLVAFLSFFVSKGQDNKAVPIPIHDSVYAPHNAHGGGYVFNASQEMDMIDVIHEIRNKHAPNRVDTDTHSLKPHLSAVPAAGYTLQTGFAALVVANAAFYTVKREDENISTIQTSLTYSQRNQIILPLQSTIWSNNNKYCFVVDWRYLKYPSYTYGLGGYSSFDNQYTIDYNAVRIHQTIFRKVKGYLYAGLGYNFDYSWDIEELDPPKPTDFEKYGLSSTESASGVTANILYDSRKNSINPQGGEFANIIYRPNFTFLGNATTWQSLIVDLRKYITFPKGTDNILAFWNYDWLTLAGNPPYLLLPNTGGDPYSNTGRGYIQGRYRGKNMVYAEGEYRFQISHSGLLGGVIFANAESFTEQASGNFEVISPGYGAGIRLKLNKFSRTNICLDYGFGSNGSGGFFVNLGEVF
ncbi:MAG: hypothetical protein P4L41_07580 [Flavipsychrobacter sp.]|nr:hypothetical protein [Flavipsychrobacter sp.]